MRLFSQSTACALIALANVTKTSHMGVNYEDYVNDLNNYLDPAQNSTDYENDLDYYPDPTRPCTDYVNWLKSWQVVSSYPAIDPDDPYDPYPDDDYDPNPDYYQPACVSNHRVRCVKWCEPIKRCKGSAENPDCQEGTRCMYDEVPSWHFNFFSYFRW